MLFLALLVILIGSDASHIVQWLTVVTRATTISDYAPFDSMFFGITTISASSSGSSSRGCDVATGSVVGEAEHRVRFVGSMADVSELGVGTGSVDGTAGTLRGAIKNGPRIRIWENPSLIEKI